MQEPLLKVSELEIGFETDDGFLPVVENVSFDLAHGKTLALVGESGCGKSLTAWALMQLLPPFGRMSRGTILLADLVLNTLSERELQSVRGNRISMIFQEPMSALNPVFNVGSQVAEALILHQDINKTDARDRAVEMLAAVGIPDPESRALNYPHELSGGMRQRVLIAMALACEPDVLIADEPTTALDVTIQAQILDLMHDLQDRLGTAILFISHDFGVVSQMADNIAVMYAGRIIEQGSARDILENAAHPYTRALLSTTPRMDASVTRLPAIAGRVPAPADRVSGCQFQLRCDRATAACSETRPELSPFRGDSDHLIACHEAH